MSLRVFRFSGQGGVDRVLGSLESKVMEVVWERKTTSIREVWETLNPKSPLSFNTVMTVMNRLAAKGMLTREGEPGGYRFQARESREAFLAGIARKVSAALVEDLGQAAVAPFVDALGRADPAALDRLEELLRRRRERG